MKTTTFLLVNLIIVLLVLSYYNSNEFVKLKPANIEIPIYEKAISEEKRTNTYEISEKEFMFKNEWASEIFDLCGYDINLRYHKDSDWQVVKKILDNDLTCNIIQGAHTPFTLQLYPSHVPCKGTSADGCYSNRNININARLLNKYRFLAQFYHEYGHHIYYIYPKNIDKRYWEELHNQTDNGYVSSYARTNVEEDFAETFIQAVFLVYYGKPYLLGLPPKKLTFMKNYLYWLNT